MYGLCPCVHLQTVIWLFYVAFGVMASSSLSGLSAHVGTGLVSLCMMTLSCQFQPASSHSVLLLFWGWYAHFAPKHVHLWVTELPEQHDGWTFPWCLYLYIIVWTDECGTFRHLEIVPKDEPDLWMSTIFFMISWLISFYFSMSHVQEAVCLRCTLKYIHRCASN